MASSQGHFVTGRWPSVQQVDDVRWRLLAPVVFLTGRRRVFVPSGYVTDFASVPRALWWLAPQSGRWNAAAVVHDYLLTDWLPARRISSPEVDAEFRRALRACQVGRGRRWGMWAGVRWAALLNPARQPGWLRTLPLLTAVTLGLLSPLLLVLFTLLHTR